MTSHNKVEPWRGRSRLARWCPTPFWQAKTESLAPEMCPQKKFAIYTSNSEICKNKCMKSFKTALRVFWKIKSDKSDNYYNSACPKPSNNSIPLFSKECWTLACRIYHIVNFDKLKLDSQQRKTPTAYGKETKVQLYNLLTTQFNKCFTESQLDYYKWSHQIKCITHTQVPSHL